MYTVIKVEFKSYFQSIKKALDLISAKDVLEKQEKIIIKPNLVTDDLPPVTTDVNCVEAIVRYCLDCSQAKIIIAEGSGGCDTIKAFNKLGYGELAKKYKLSLFDIDREGIFNLADPKAFIYKEIKLPKTLLDGYLISVPVLKDHSITCTTLSLKNMIGLLPEEYYSGFWSYKKSNVHKIDVDKAIIDVNRYRKPDLCVIDGRIGQKRCHLSGPPCDPPKNVILASYDPIAIDIVGSSILGWDYQNIKYLRYARDVFGERKDIRIIEG